MRRIHVTSVAAAVAAILASGTAPPRPRTPARRPRAEAARVIEEIVVTAQRREESIQDVPLSVQAFTGETLVEAGVNSVLDLPRLAPNFNAMRGTQTANVRLSIRGVGASSNSAIDPSIGTFIDGVYVPRPGSLFGATERHLQRGSAARPAGHAVRPQLDGGRRAAAFGEPAGRLRRQRRTAPTATTTSSKFVGMLNAPMGDRFALRFAGLTDSRDGYAHNRYDNEDFATARVRRDPRRREAGTITDDLTWTLKYDRSQPRRRRQGRTRDRSRDADGRFARTTDADLRRQPAGPGRCVRPQEQPAHRGRRRRQPVGRRERPVLGARRRPHRAVPRRLSQLGQRAARVRRAVHARRFPGAHRSRSRAPASRTNCS